MAAVWIRSRRARRVLVAAASGFAIAGPFGVRAAPEEDAQALLVRAWTNLYAGDFVQVLALTSRSGTGRVMRRRLQLVRKQSALPGRALVRFLEPEDIRGTSLLLLESDEHDDDLFVYLPAVGRARRVSAAQRSDAFFGTNLTYEDLEPKRASDYTATFSDRPRGEDCLWLEIRPRPEISSQYEAILSCLETTRAVLLRSEYYAHGRLQKVLEGDPRSVRDFGERRLVVRARLVTPSSGFETSLEIESYDGATAVPDSLFTIPNLEYGDERGDRARAKSGATPEPAPR